MATKLGRGIFVGTDFSGYDDGIYLRDDGTIVKHSFFYVLKSNRTVSMVVLDGDIYYND